MFCLTIAGDWTKERVAVSRKQLGPLAALVLNMSTISQKKAAMEKTYCTNMDTCQTAKH